MASVALGLGLGTEGLTKREVAGPVPFRMSESWSVRAEGRGTRVEGRRAYCSHFLPITNVKIMSKSESFSKKSEYQKKQKTKGNIHSN